jgi:hypothetical protein
VRAAALAEAHMDITKLAIEQQLGGSADAESTTG